jgi:hypothetical protein
MIGDAFPQVADGAAADSNELSASVRSLPAVQHTL